MKHLEYIKDGVLKTYDLDFSFGSIVLGRSTSCDITIEDDYISQRHLELSLFEDKIKLVHLSKKNPIIIDKLETNSALVNINDKFMIADFEFSIKEKSKKRLIYSIGSNGKDESSDSRKIDTKINRKKFDSDILFASGIRNKNNDPEFIFKAGIRSIKTIFSSGCFLIVGKNENKYRIITELILDNISLVSKNIELSKLTNTKKKSFTMQKHIFFPFKLKNTKPERLFLIYYRKGKEKLDDLNRNFIEDFIKEFQSIINDYSNQNSDKYLQTLPIITNNNDLLGKLKQLS